MDLLQQQDQPGSNNADASGGKSHERTVVWVCVVVGVIGVTMLLAVVLSA